MIAFPETDFDGADLDDFWRYGLRQYYSSSTVSLDYNVVDSCLHVLAVGMDSSDDFGCVGAILGSQRALCLHGVGRFPTLTSALCGASESIILGDGADLWGSPLRQGPDTDYAARVRAAASTHGMQNGILYGDFDVRALITEWTHDVVPYSHYHGFWVRLRAYQTPYLPLSSGRYRYIGFGEEISASVSSSVDGPAPFFLRICRNGSNVKGYTSTDGGTWNEQYSKTYAGPYAIVCIEFAAEYRYPTNFTLETGAKIDYVLNYP